MTRHQDRPATDRFDGAYYRRFYGPGGAHDRRRISHLANSVHEMAAWWGVNVRSVLDVGAGVGMWRDWYSFHHPRVKVTSVDVSEHACLRWGHEQRDISTWAPTRRYDLVVCHSVLQYLGDAQATAAIANLATASRHLLYLEVPTLKDFETVVDPRATDMSVHRRQGHWYRRRLNRYFDQVGAGIWVRHGSVPMYELESVGRTQGTTTDPR